MAAGGIRVLIPWAFQPESSAKSRGWECSVKLVSGRKFNEKSWRPSCWSVLPRAAHPILGHEYR